MSDDIFPLDIDAVMLRDTAKKLSDGGLTVEVRPGLEIIGRFDFDPVIRADGKDYELPEVPGETRQEIMIHARRHDRAIKNLRESKYTDPATNPMIRFNTQK